VLNAVLRPVPHLLLLGLLCASEGQATPPQRTGMARETHTPPRQPTHQHLRRKHLRMKTPPKERDTLQETENEEMARAHFANRLKKLRDRFDRQALEQRSEDSLSDLQREILELHALDFYDNIQEIVALKAQLNERMAAFNRAQRGTFGRDLFFDIEAPEEEGSDGEVAPQPLPQ
jgi:hypothetical protein